MRALDRKLEAFAAMLADRRRVAGRDDTTAFHGNSSLPFSRSAEIWDLIFGSREVIKSFERYPQRNSITQISPTMRQAIPSAMCFMLNSTTEPTQKARAAANANGRLEDQNDSFFKLGSSLIPRLSNHSIELHVTFVLQNR